MKQLIPIFFLFTTLVYSQSDFWSHYSLNVPVRQLVKAKDGIGFAISDTLILKSTDFGFSWENLFINLTDSIEANSIRLEISNSIVNSNVMIIKPRRFTSNFLPKISLDNGITWNNLVYPGLFKDIAINTQGAIYLVSDTVYKSTDYGTNWIPINIPIDDSLTGQIEIDQYNNIYLTKGMGEWYWDPNIPPYYYWLFNNYIYKSLNDGDDWQWFFGELTSENLGEIFLNNKDHLIVNVLYFVYQVSFDTSFYYNLNTPINDAISLNDQDKFVSSELYGIKQTSDGGQNWVSLNSGLPSSHTYSLIIDSIGYVYTGTENGIYKSVDPIIDPNHLEYEFASIDYNLSNSYPNPFNPTTTIEYQVPKTSNVKISVFNLVGEEITVLVDEEKVQGKYKVEFSGTKLSSGVYFYKMQSDNFISTKKFVLLK